MADRLRPRFVCELGTQSVWSDELADRINRLICVRNIRVQKDGRERHLLAHPSSHGYFPHG